MYCNYFCFKNDPFSPDLDILFQSKSWASVYRQLTTEIQANREVLLLTGQSGIGKSYLLKALESRLESQIKFIHQHSDSINYEDFIENLCMQLALNSENKDLSQKIQLLNFYLSEQQYSHILLVIEDADLLSDTLMVKIEPNPAPLVQQQALVQIILTGDPSLKEKYDRIAAVDPHAPAFAWYTLEPLQESECAAYIRRRLQLVGDTDSALFPQSTLDAVWQITHGVPGSVNNLCTAALKSALTTGQKTITPELIRKIGETGFDWHPERMNGSAESVPVASTDLVHLDNQKKMVLQESPGQKALGGFLNKKTARYSAVALGAFLLFYLFILGTDIERNSGDEPGLAGTAQTIQQPKSRNQAGLGSTEFYPQQRTIRPLPSPDSPPDEADSPLPTSSAQRETESPKLRIPTIVKPAVQDSAPAGESARQYIRKQETEGPVVTLDEIYKEAQLMGQQNRNSDAYLLYFYAARLGHRDAAFKLGQISDPATFQRKLNFVGSPDPIQAYKWYQKAANAGHVKARLALTRLRTYITKQASTGNRTAERWLLLWK